MTTVQEGLVYLSEYLARDPDECEHYVSIPNPAREARLLLAFAMGVRAERLILLSYDIVSEGAMERAFVYGARRRGGEPASHILGYRAFYGRDFYVDTRVLDPRPETECLIVEALSVPFTEFLDLGTGSGAIAVTLAAERPTCLGVATDISERAIEVAEQNAATVGVTDRIGFLQSDWYDAVGGTYDLIVSNPPYIAADEMDALQPEVRLYEPRMALTDEGDGLGAYRIITNGAPAHLNPGGRLIVEIGPTQGQAVADMMRAAGLDDVRILPDLDGRDRVVVGCNPDWVSDPRHEG